MYYSLVIIAVSTLVWILFYTKKINELIEDQHD